MSLTSLLTSLLVHSCRIDRGIEGAPDRYQHTEKTWPPGETVPCLIQDFSTREGTAQEILGPTLGGQVIYSKRIYLLPSVVFAEQDRITDVTPGHKADEYDVKVKQTWDYGSAPHHEAFVMLIGTGEVS